MFNCLCLLSRSKSKREGVRAMRGWWWGWVGFTENRDGLFQCRLPDITVYLILNMSRWYYTRQSQPKVDKQTRCTGWPYVDEKHYSVADGLGAKGETIIGMPDQRLRDNDKQPSLSLSLSLLFLYWMLYRSEWLTAYI